MPALAAQMGLKWGGTAFHNYPDRVHFKIPTGKMTITEDVYKEVEETVKIRAYDSEAVFSNFKVNKFAFNFFRKNLQFDPEYRNVKNRQIYNADGSLQEVIIKSVKHAGK